MIHDLDETIKHILKEHGKLNSGEIDIAFDQPTGDWAATLSRPTINLYLYDIRENTELRRRQPQVERRYNDHSTRRAFPPKRIDLSYLITVWARNPEDEHQLLWRVLATLSRFMVIDPLDDGQGVVRDQPVPMPAEVAMPSEALRNMPDLWGVMENQLKPSINFKVTVALDVEDAIEAPMVLTSQIRIGQSDERNRELAVTSITTYHIGGRVLEGETAIPGAQVTLLNRGDNVETDDEGRYVFAYLHDGEYELEVQIEGRKAKTYKIEVPAPSYDLAL